MVFVNSFFSEKSRNTYFLRELQELLNLNLNLNLDLDLKTVVLSSSNVLHPLPLPLPLPPPTPSTAFSQLDSTRLNSVKESTSDQQHFRLSEAIYQQPPRTATATSPSSINQHLTLMTNPLQSSSVRPTHPSNIPTVFQTTSTQSTKVKQY